MKRLLATLAIPFILSACGSDSDESHSQGFTTKLSLGSDLIATFEMGDVEQASADITITITNVDGSAPASDSDVTIEPLMEMVSGMMHDTPMASRTGTLDENHQFKTKVYFLMPSGPEMGTWYFTVGFDGEEETFSVDVNMMISDREVLAGTNDKISSMGNEVGRPYMLFNEARHVMQDMDSFTVFIAARETMLKHTALIEGITLTGETEMPMMEMSLSTLNASTRAMVMADYDLHVTTALVEMCANDCETESNWITAVAVADYPGQFKATELGLTGDDSDSILIRLTVNDEVKIKGDSTAYATFSFNGSGESTMTHSM